ncbi:MAG: TerB family tellurite resistance protein [Deltaproteobacteria bacterium]|nr:TerB family tellurite resistance protein [Deltaproteobacteria bacterium]
MDAADLLGKVPSLEGRSATEEVDDAILDAITLSACADGVNRAELAALLRMARQLPTLEGRPHPEIDARVHAAFARVEADGLEGRLAGLAKASFDDDARRRIFCAAAVVQYADGLVTNEENEFLLDLADVLGLDDMRVQEILAEIEAELD